MLVLIYFDTKFRDTKNKLTFLNILLNFLNQLRIKKKTICRF